jgi:hypothetical protein
VRAVQGLVAGVAGWLGLGVDGSVVLVDRALSTTPTIHEGEPMSRPRFTRSLATALAVGTLGVVAAATPAMALPTDSVSIDTTKVDIGSSWASGSPTSGAVLDWSNANGATCLTGNLYMKNAPGVSAKVELEIYTNASHGATELPLATTKSTKKTAVGNALNVFPISLPCINSPGTHAHVRLLDDHNNVGGPLTLSSISFQDE